MIFSVIESNQPNLFWQDLCDLLMRTRSLPETRKKLRMDPNDLIDSIVDAIDYVEVAMDMQGLIKARRLLNNDLRQAIDLYVQEEVTKALQETSVGSRHELARAGSS
jgi:hypothetical protein